MRQEMGCPVSGITHGCPECRKLAALSINCLIDLQQKLRRVLHKMSQSVVAAKALGRIFFPSSSSLVVCLSDSQSDSLTQVADKHNLVAR